MIDNILFDSKAEGMYYLYLKDLEKDGCIRDLTLQQKFLIHPRFQFVDPVKRGKKRYKKSILAATYYIPDFTFTVRMPFSLIAGPVNLILNPGEQVVVDVKGMRTALYRLKRKMFLRQYPELVFIES